MVRHGVGVDDDVVNVDGAELVILLEKEIHGPLECGGRVVEVKGHDAELEATVAGLKGGAFAVLGATWIWWKQDRRSILVNTREPAMESRHSSMRGTGYTTFWVNALRRR